MPETLAPNRGDELVFLPLGGAGEIGMNLNLYGYGSEHNRKWIIVDLGVMFGNERTPGIDLIMADPRFIIPFRDQILGLILTHGHEDHIGAVAYIWPLLRCPIYATPFTASLVRYKLEEAGLRDEAKVTLVPLGGRIGLGPFDVELVTLTHSIPEPNALAVRTPLGCVLHTGDWKIDSNPLIGDVADEDYLRNLRQKGVAAMVCDSTNVFVPGYAGSEADVRKSLLELVGGLKGRVAITCFASNVARLETVAHVADAHGRHLCLVGRSMHRMLEAARSVGMLQKYPLLIAEEDAGYLPPDRVLYLCTGSQGEQRAALGRIVNGNHSHIILERGDTVIFSSKIIPGNEILIYELQNKLADMGVRIITEQDHFVHVSGHPCRDELTLMYQWIRPQLAIAVHGEVRHLLEHAELARKLRVPKAIAPRNGSMIRIAPGDSCVMKQVPNGRLYVDGRVVVGEDDSHLKERRQISYVGHVNIALAFDPLGQMLALPEIRLQGLPEARLDDEDDLVGGVEKCVLDVLEKMTKKKRENDESIGQATRIAVQRLLVRSYGKKPVVDVSIIRV